jgi:hypothetical protein
MNTTNSQAGLGHVVLVLLIALVLGAVGFAGWKVLGNSKDSEGVTSTTQAEKTVSESKIVMNSVGFKLDNYDEATNRAGDMEFTKIPILYDQIWADFGQQDPRSPNDPTKRNPQPTYILPLGTKVESLVDGKVAEVKQLYSGDYTIMVQPDGSDLLFETEHVDNPKVKVGDMVKSGQVIAEVSKYDAHNHPGFGTLEIGVLGQKNNRPSHTCPYLYLDASVKDDILAKITNVHDAWEKYLGKDIYPANPELPGCTTLASFDE